MNNNIICRQRDEIWVQMGDNESIHICINSFNQQPFYFQVKKTEYYLE